MYHSLAGRLFHIFRLTACFSKWDVWNLGEIWDRNRWCKKVCRKTFRRKQIIRKKSEKNVWSKKYIFDRKKIDQHFFENYFFDRKKIQKKMVDFFQSKICFFGQPFFRHFFSKKNSTIFFREQYFWSPIPIPNFPKIPKIQNMKKTSCEAVVHE